MSKLAQLQGKSKTYKIGPIELELRPLRLDEADLVTVDESMSPEEQEKHTIKLIDTVLKDAVPDSTEEERNSINLEFRNPLMNAIMDINGKGDKTRSPIDAIKARQAEVEAARKGK